MVLLISYPPPRLLPSCIAFVMLLLTMAKEGRRRRRAFLPASILQLLFARLDVASVMSRRLEERLRLDSRRRQTRDKSYFSPAFFFSSSSHGTSHYCCRCSRSFIRMTRRGIRHTGLNLHSQDWEMRHLHTHRHTCIMMIITSASVAGKRVSEGEAAATEHEMMMGRGSRDVSFAFQDSYSYSLVHVHHISYDIRSPALFTLTLLKSPKHHNVPTREREERERERNDGDRQAACD